MNTDRGQVMYDPFVEVMIGAITGAIVLVAVGAIGVDLAGIHRAAPLVVFAVGAAPGWFIGEHIANPPYMETSTLEALWNRMRERQ